MTESNIYPDDIAGVTDAAKHAKVTVQTIYTRIRRGELPAFRIGSSRLKVRLSDVDALYRPYTPTRVKPEQVAV